MPCPTRPAPAPSLVLCCLAVSAVMLQYGCSMDDGRDSGGLFGAEGKRDEQAAQIDRWIGDLRLVANLERGEDEAIYATAVQRLSERGAPMESRMIELLATAPDWGTRYGAIEVLDAVGTRACVDSLIQVLAGDHPLVAFKALVSLRVITEHRILPEQGEDVVMPEGLTPIPARAEDDLRSDAEEQIWAAWYAEYGPALAEAWAAWWRDQRP